MFNQILPTSTIRTVQRTLMLGLKGFCVCVSSPIGQSCSRYRALTISNPDSLKFPPPLPPPAYVKLEPVSLGCYSHLFTIISHLEFLLFETMYLNCFTSRSDLTEEKVALKCYYDQKIPFIFSSDFKTRFVKHSPSEIISVNFEKKTVNLNCNFPV